MPMRYAHTEISEGDVPRAAFPFAQHMLDTYASETSKVVSIWRCFSDADLSHRPHERATTVEEIMRHQLLSERRFFGEFLELAEPAPEDTLPATTTVAALSARFAALARARLPQLAEREEPWWLVRVPFFDVERERVWIFWRRVLHTAHHRTQLTTYLRVMGRDVPSTYGPTADVSWEGADPTDSVDAAGRR
ncbi:MAG: DinB family protein [Gemmatimonadota bacterium]